MLGLRGVRLGIAIPGLFAMQTRAILEAAASYSIEEASHIAEQWRQRLAGQMVSDSAHLIREDRER